MGEEGYLTIDNSTYGLPLSNFAGNQVEPPLTSDIEIPAEIRDPLEWVEKTDPEFGTPCWGGQLYKLQRLTHGVRTTQNKRSDLSPKEIDGSQSKFKSFP